jgi:hypothetical protein
MDGRLPPNVRIRAAEALLPYLHPRLSSVAIKPMRSEEDGVSEDVAGKLVALGWTPPGGVIEGVSEVEGDEEV